MSLKKVGGSKIYIGSRVAYKSVIATADFAGMTWTQIKNWQSAGDLGAEDEALTRTIIDQNVTLYAKGPISFPIMQNAFIPTPDDAGQLALKVARASCKPYAFKIEWGAECGSESQVTISNADPAVISWSAHGLPVGTPIVFSTTGTLPTGLLPGVTYYTVTSNVNSFQVAAVPGGAAIATTSIGTGTHTATAQDAGETDLLFALAMRATKTAGDASADRLMNVPLQPIAEFITV